MQISCQRAALAVALLCSSIPSLAQGPIKDESAIRSIVQSQANAWNRGDADAFAAHYADNGDFTNVIGQQLYGRKAFVAQHAKIFSTINKGSHNELTVSKITFLRSDVVLVDIDGTLSGATGLPPGLKANDDGTLRVKLLEVMTKEKNGWVIAAFHNVSVSTLPPGGGGRQDERVTPSTRPLRRAFSKSVSQKQFAWMFWLTKTGHALIEHSLSGVGGLVTGNAVLVTDAERASSVSAGNSRSIRPSSAHVYPQIGLFGRLPSNCGASSGSDGALQPLSRPKRAVNVRGRAGGRPPAPEADLQNTGYVSNFGSRSKKLILLPLFASRNRR